MGKDWDSFYAAKGAVLLLPHPSMPELVDLFNKKGVRRVLDLGCGSGRHLTYLASKGFRVSGIDSSETALSYARESLEEQKLTAELTCGSFYERLPYPDDCFDAVVCCRALNHGTIEQISLTVNEIERVLTEPGLIFVEVRKPHPPFGSKQKLRWEEIVGPRTTVHKTGAEKGVTHFHFNKAILLKEFSDFKILKFWVDDAGYYCLVGQLKW